MHTTSHGPVLNSFWPITWQCQSQPWSKMTKKRFGVQPRFSKEEQFRIVSGAAGCTVDNTLWISHKYCSSPQMGARSKYTEHNTDFILKFHFQPQRICFIRQNKHSKDFTSMQTKYFWPTLTCSSALGVAAVLLISSHGNNLGIDFWLWVFCLYPGGPFTLHEQIAALFLVSE